MNSGTIITIGCVVGVILGLVSMFRRKREIKKEATKQASRVEPSVDSLDLGDSDGGDD